MVDGTSLYKHRKAVDPLRQPRFSGIFYELDKALSLLQPPKGSPYSLASTEYSRMAMCSGYPSILKGDPAKCATEYCYRLTTWPRLVRDVYDIPATQLWTLPREADEGEAGRFISGKLGKRTWLPLSNLVSGVLRGRRGFTWWTSAEFPTSNLMCRAHMTGLLNSEVGGEVLILRCRTERLSIAVSTVPTIVDAFFSHIFHSMPDEDCPTCGRAISIEDPNHLSLGAEEFLVGDLNVQGAAIEVNTLNLNTAVVHQVQAEDVYPSLLAYYGSLS